MVVARYFSLAAGFACVALLSVPSGPVKAQPNPGTDIQRRQDAALEQTQDRVVRESALLRAVPDAGNPSAVVASETPCYELSRIDLIGAEPYPWMQAKVDLFAGRCLGAGSLKRLRDFLTLHLLERGYVTARTGYPKQNLAAGVLVIEVIPGYVAAIREEGQRIGRLDLPLATSTGRLLNQEDLDQTLENLLRLSSQAGARIELLPGAALGETDLLIRHGTASRWQADISLDNGGTRDTGKNQLSANLGVDSLLGLYDTLTISYNTNADMMASALANRASGLQWGVPLGYGQVQLGTSRSYYKQTVAGYNGPIEYTGDSRSLELGLAWVTYRGSRHKGETRLALYRKHNRNFIDGSEIDVQTRDTSGWEISHTHKHQSGPWNWGGSVTHRRSMPDWSKTPGILAGVPEWDGRFSVWQAQMNVSRQGVMAGYFWRYLTQVRVQEGGVHLPASEYFSIGGRYSVRGFDGEQTLSAESGAYWRNELGLSKRSSTRPGIDLVSGTAGAVASPGPGPLGLSSTHELFLALDGGRISGPQSHATRQRTLVGAALGVRGNRGRLGYEISAYKPVTQPDYFFSKSPTLAVTLRFALH